MTILTKVLSEPNIILYLVRFLVRRDLRTGQFTDESVLANKNIDRRLRENKNRTCSRDTVWQNRKKRARR